MKKPDHSRDAKLRLIAIKRFEHDKFRANENERRGRIGTRPQVSRFELVARKAEKIRRIVQFPRCFSFVVNPEETLKTFDEIHKYVVVDKIPIYLDASKVEDLTVDALLYLLAIFNRLNWQGQSHSVRGNIPKNDRAKLLFVESGFYEHVKTSQRTPSNKCAKCVKIDSGASAKPSAAKNICQFAIEVLGHTKISARGLYDLVFEIILNTIQHAYDRDLKHVKWYSYARFDDESNEVYFALLDTGYGIPRTVQKNFVEFFQRILAGLEVTDSIDVALIESALRGDFRTKTSQHYRGKGMPKIREYCDKGYISDLTIVSGRAYVAHGAKKTVTLPSHFTGTLYTWKMKQMQGKTA